MTEKSTSHAAPTEDGVVGTRTGETLMPKFEEQRRIQLSGSTTRQENNHSHVGLSYSTRSQELLMGAWT